MASEENTQDQQHDGGTAVADSGKLRQNVEISDVGPCKKHVKVTVDRNAIDERFKDKYATILAGATAKAKA